MTKSEVVAGDSQEQCELEPEMLALLGARLSLTLAPKSISIAGGSRIDIDGVSEIPPVLCEVFAHLGRLRPGQTRKIITDAFKLIYVERLMGLTARKIILLADPQAARSFGGRSWVSRAFDDYGIEVHVIQLCSESEERLRLAQARQVR